MRFDTFLDVTHFLRGVNASNLFLRHPNISVDVVEGLEYAISLVGVEYSRWGHNFEILAVKMAKNSQFWLSEASRGL